VLLPRAGSILEADARLAPLLDDDALEQVAAFVPDEWLLERADDGGSAGERRQAYVDYFSRRLSEPRGFAEEAERARLATR
jgi:hypothetical protein